MVLIRAQSPFQCCPRRILSGATSSFDPTKLFSVGVVHPRLWVRGPCKHLPNMRSLPPRPACDGGGLGDVREKDCNILQERLQLLVWAAPGAPGVRSKGGGASRSLLAQVAEMLRGASSLLVFRALRHEGWSCSISRIRCCWLRWGCTRFSRRLRLPSLVIGGVRVALVGDEALLSSAGEAVSGNRHTDSGPGLASSHDDDGVFDVPAGVADRCPSSRLSPR